MNANERQKKRREYLKREGLPSRSLTASVLLIALKKMSIQNQISHSVIDEIIEEMMFIFHEKEELDLRKTGEYLDKILKGSLKL